MKYHCDCNCHCDCNHKVDSEKGNAEGGYLMCHLLSCACVNGPQSPCCEECKDLPENFTFEDLCHVAPPLLCLFKAAQEFKRLAEGREEQVCGNAIWYSAMKPILLREVGLAAHHPLAKMNGSKAYSLAYKTISDELPFCTHEGLCGML